MGRTIGEEQQSSLWPGRGAGRLVAALKRLLRPGVLLPLILGLALLAALLAVGNVGQILALAASFQRVYLIYIVLLILAYEVARYLIWRFMLHSLGIQVPPRTQIFSFMTGEVSRDLPIGNFVPDYVLRATQGTDFGLASSATLLITLLEVAVSLAGVVIIGIDGWNWLRPLILVGVFVFALVVWAFYRWHHAPHVHRRVLPRRLLQIKGVRPALDELRQFARGEAALLHPHVLAIGATLAAMYLILGGSSLYLTILGLGGISWPQALAVSFFSLAVAAIVPLPMDFGTVEVSGAGVLVVLGMSRSAAVSVMLLNRLFTVGATLLIAAVTGLILRDEVARALRSRPHPQETPPAGSGGEGTAEG